MPIRLMQPTDNIFQSKCKAFVCPVNTVGVMGAGLAREFRRRFPDYYDYYRWECGFSSGVKLTPPTALRLGVVSACLVQAGNTNYIYSFPTKADFRTQSRLVDIYNGLGSLVESVSHLGIKSIAVPALGCGLGGLNWGEVLPLIEQAFAELPDVLVKVYPPKEVQE